MSDAWTRKFQAARFAGFFAWPDLPAPWARRFLWTSVSQAERPAVHRMHVAVRLALLQTGHAIARGMVRDGT